MAVYTLTIQFTIHTFTCVWSVKKLSSFTAYLHVVSVVLIITNILHLQTIANNKISWPKFNFSSKLHWFVGEESILIIMISSYTFSLKVKNAYICLEK